MVFGFLKRDPLELPFKDFIKRLVKDAGEEYAFKFRDSVVDLLLRDSSLLYSDVEKMKWKDVSYKIKRIERQSQMELESLNTLIEAAMNTSKSSSFFDEPGWQYGLENVDDMR